MAIIFAIGGIISLFRRKKRWKIPYRVYFDEKKMKFKTINDLGIIKEHDPERVGEVYNEITEFYMNPYQVD